MLLSQIVSTLILLSILLSEIIIFSCTSVSFPVANASVDRDHIEGKVLNGLQKSVAAQIVAKKEMAIPLSIFETNFENIITSELDEVNLQKIGDKNQISFFRNWFTNAKDTLQYEVSKTLEDKDNVKDKDVTCYPSPNSGCFSTSAT